MRGAVVDNYSNYGGSNYSNYGGSNYSNYGGSNPGYGERSGAQRGLKVLAILYVIGGVFILLWILYMWSLFSQAESAVGGSLTPMLVQEMSRRGFAVSSESELTSLVFAAVIVFVTLGLSLLLTGILGIRAANDPEKVTPYLVISGLSLAYTILNIVRSIVANTFDLSIETLIGVGIPVLAVWLGVSVKQQRDQARMPGAQW